MLTCIIITSLSILTLANYQKKDVDICVTLGMIKGDNSVITDDYLGTNLTRLQAAIMVLRLRGLEDDAIAYNSQETFHDANQITWTDGQAILAYLANHREIGFYGDEQGNFNPTDYMTTQGFYKVMLTALGYEQGVDFTWNEVATFAEGLGFSKTSKDTLTIADVAGIVVKALKTKNKEGVLLVDALIASGDIDKTDIVESGLIDASISILASETKEKDLKREKEALSDEELFNQPDIEKLLSIDLVSIENGIVYVNEESSYDDAVRHHKPESQYIDNVNSLLYRLIRSRFENSNARNSFTRVKYVVNNTYGNGTKSTCIFAGLTTTYKSSYPQFGFIFEEQNLDKDYNPYDAPIILDVNRLIDWTSSVDSKSDVIIDKYYIKMLENDLEALFGELGSEICKFIVDEYNYSIKVRGQFIRGEIAQDETAFEHSKKVGNMTVYSRFLSNIFDLKFYFKEN